MAEEKRFETKIKDYLRSKGCYVLKTFGNAYQAKGTPDLICCVNGHFVAVEVKAKNGKVSDLQWERISEINDANGTALVLYPKDFETFKIYIERLL